MVRVCFGLRDEAVLVRVEQREHLVGFRGGFCTGDLTVVVGVHAHEVTGASRTASFVSAVSERSDAEGGGGDEEGNADEFHGGSLSAPEGIGRLPDFGGVRSFQDGQRGDPLRSVAGPITFFVEPFNV